MHSFERHGEGNFDATATVTCDLTTFYATRPWPMRSCDSTLTNEISWLDLDQWDLVTRPWPMRSCDSTLTNEILWLDLDQWDLGVLFGCVTEIIDALNYFLTYFCVCSRWDWRPVVKLCRQSNVSLSRNPKLTLSWGQCSSQWYHLSLRSSQVNWRTSTLRILVSNTHTSISRGQFRAGLKNPALSPNLQHPLSPSLQPPLRTFCVKSVLYLLTYLLTYLRIRIDILLRFIVCQSCKSTTCWH